MKCLKFKPSINFVTASYIQFMKETKFGMSRHSARLHSKAVHENSTLKITPQHKR